MKKKPAVTIIVEGGAVVAVISSVPVMYKVSDRDEWAQSEWLPATVEKKRRKT